MKFKIFFLHLTLLLFSFATSANAQDDVSAVDLVDNRDERVINFTSYLYLGKNNQMEVEEKIRIYSTGKIFKRGLRRVLPQERSDVHGHKKSMPIYVTDVKCDGKETPWHAETDEDNNYIIYIGDANVFLDEGEYEYTITYQAPGHIGQFDDHDEIYWNVNGFGWQVPFDTLFAAVFPPDGTESKKFYAYTGKKGERGTDYITEKDSTDGTETVAFMNTRQFKGGENMSIVLEFSKGSQQALTTFQVWKDDIYALLVVLGFFIYCLVSWCIKGVDPKKPTVVPQYIVPEGVSAPMAAKFMYADVEKQVTASFMSLLVKGGAAIKLVNDSEYQITKMNGAELDEYDTCVQERLFESKDQIRTDIDYNDIAGVRSKLTTKLDSDYDSKYYVFNSGCFIAATIFGGLGAFYIYAYLEALDWVIYVSLAAMVVIYIWYFCVIGKYTDKGIDMRAKMEGLKMYIETAEKLRMRTLTPEHFEDLLPYAVAFGVEVEWCKQFEKVLKKYNYRPSWYDSSSTYKSSALFDSNSIMSITHGFTQATAHSFATYDSEQSSSSGGDWGGGSGGSSGGGGGGGGGGGW